MFTLEAKKRDIKQDLTKLRAEGFIPAVFYGKKEKSTPISVPMNQFVKVWKEAGESSVVTLKADDETLDTLIQDIDFDPVTGVPRHADFYVFEKGHKLEVSVPLEFVGVSAGVKDLGGLLVKVLYELKIEALPQNLPHQIEIDISALDTIGSQITAKDIVLPTGVELKENGDEIVVLVSQPKAEEEVEAVPIDLSQIEVEKKGKEKNAEEEVPPSEE